MNIGRVVRFGIVGVFNTGSYYCLYLLLHLTLPYMVAHVFAFACAMVGSYFLNCYFTFRIRPTLRKFLLFPLSNITNFVITSTGLYLLVDVMHLNQTVSPLLAAALAVPVTFIVAQLVLVGRNTRDKNSSSEKIADTATQDYSQPTTKAWE